MMRANCADSPVAASVSEWIRRSFHSPVRQLRAPSLSRAHARGCLKASGAALCFWRPSWLLRCAGARRSSSAATASRCCTAASARTAALTRISPRRQRLQRPVRIVRGPRRRGPVDLHPVPGVAESWKFHPTAHLHVSLARQRPLVQRRPGDRADFVAPAAACSRPRSPPKRLLALSRAGRGAFHRGQSTDFASVGIAAPDPGWCELPSLIRRRISSRCSTTPCGSRAPADRGEIRSGRPTPATRGRDPVRWWATVRSLSWSGAPAAHRRRQVADLLGCRHRTPAGDSFLSVRGGNEERAFRADQLHLTDALRRQRSKPTPHSTEPAPHRSAARYLLLPLNTARPPLDDVRVRRALALAVDRTAIVERSSAAPAPRAAFTPPGTPVTRPPASDDFAPGAPAGEAGFPRQGLPVLELLFNSSETHR